MKKLGFDTLKYLKVQKRAIEERLAKFSGRLYLEFGGKLLDDFHAVRTLPGYDPNSKLLLLKSLKKDLGILYCISSKQLTNGKIRGDWGVGYDLATIRTLEDLKKNDIPLIGVVITRFDGENEAINLERRLNRMGVKVYKRREIKEYPNNLSSILSKNGFGNDDYVETGKSLVVVWGSGSGSGKLSTCLGQIYNDNQRGVDSGYAKFETFPVWDLPLDHPVNVAYEAAAADLGDYNLVDNFHYQAYQEVVVNYNRDIDSFPVVKAIFEQITSKNNFARQYRSPTDMGVNLLKQGIVDNAVVEEAAKKEINFYLFRYLQEYRKGIVSESTLEKMKTIMGKVGINEDYLPVVPQARAAADKAKNQKGKGDKGVYCGAAIELADGNVVTGKNSSLLHAEAAAVLNAVKKLAKIDDSFDLISLQVIKQVKKMKKQINEASFSLNCAEALLALAVSSQTNPLAERALKFLGKLKDCFMHTTHQPSAADEALFRKLGIWVSTDGKVEKAIQPER